MSSSFVSTQAISTATRLSILKMQSELAKSNQEAASGRHADIGLAAGARTGQTISLRQDYSRLEALADANGTVSARLDASQAALDPILDDAKTFLANLITVRNGGSTRSVIGPDADSKLSAMIGGLNGALNGQYLFAGINTDVKPVADYISTPASAGKAALDTAFQTAFGMTQTSPSVSTISQASMQGFIDGAVSSLYAAPAWSTNWSAASSQNIRSRITSTDVIETSANANDVAFRDLAKAYTMVRDLGTTGLSDGAYRAVIDSAIAAVSRGAEEVASVKATLGIAQSRLSDAGTRIEAQKTILNTHINSIETVDPYEASTRVTMLTNQLELSYKITSQMHQLSLLDYL